MIRNVVRALTPRKYRLVRRIAERIKVRAACEVVSGPFAGMKLEGGAVGSAETPRILGTYELELAPLIESIDWSRFDKVVDVGAAEGYYAVGLARRRDVRKVVAFEGTEAGRRLLAQTAHRNAVEPKLEIHGLCDLPALAQQLTPENGVFFLLMDIEGGEAILLDPRVIPALRHTFVVVEVHEFAVEGLAEMLRSRFETTHSIERIDPRPRKMSDFPPSLLEFGWLDKSFGGSAVVASMSEGRPESTFWFILRPNSFPTLG